MRADHPTLTMPLRRPVFAVRQHRIGVTYPYLSDENSPSAIVLGDSMAVLSSMPANSVQTVVTSPPYWWLRDYGIEGQIGLNETVYAYVDTLADMFDQVMRVLRSDGTLWLNIGDSYTSGNRRWRAPDKKNRARAMSLRPPTPEGPYWCAMESCFRSTGTWLVPSV